MHHPVQGGASACFWCHLWVWSGGLWVICVGKYLGFSGVKWLGSTGGSVRIAQQEIPRPQLGSDIFSAWEKESGGGDDLFSPHHHFV